MLTSLQIKQYETTIWTNILSSQFVYEDLNQKCELKKQELIIESKKKKHIYYLYLFLTTNQKPYVTKKSVNKKKNIAKVRRAPIIWKVRIEKQKLFEMFTLMLFQIIPFQANSEKKILKVNRKTFNLIINYAPLTNQTIALKSKTGYFPDIRLIWRLKWNQQASLFQKIFFLKHFQVLNDAYTFQYLENDDTEDQTKFNFFF